MFEPCCILSPRVFHSALWVLSIHFFDALFLMCCNPFWSAPLEKKNKESGSSSWRRATTVLLMARDPARMVRSSCWWRPTITTRKNTPWVSFIEFCVNGRTSKSGEWTSKGVGKYLEGGKEAGGQLVDQRFCPRIVEGELRYNLVGDALVGIIHKKPKEGGISAVGGTGSVYTYYGPEEPLFAALTNNFLKKDLQHVMPALGLADEPLPLWWTTDFINSSPPGTKPEDEKWIVGEFLGLAEDVVLLSQWES